MTLDFESFMAGLRTGIRLGKGAIMGLITKLIRANGTYRAADEGAEGFSAVTVNVPNSYTAADEGKVVVSGALEAQTARSSEITQNGTYDTTTNNSVTVDVSGGGGAEVLSGTGEPDPSQGGSGAIYLQYAPAGYSYIDYLEFVNGSYIDLNIVPSNHKLIMVANDYQYVSEKNWFGTTAGPRYFNFTPFQNLYYWGNNGTEGHASLAWSAGKKTLVFNGDNNEKTLDGTVLDSGTFSASAASLLIGKRNYTSKAAYLRVYSVKLWDKATALLVRDMIPVKRSSDDALGLYDLANDVFYPNSGTGTFIAGTEFADEAVILAYAKVNGAWQELIGTSITDIDTGN